jgi:hypothetical protein
VCIVDGRVYYSRWTGMFWVLAGGGLDLKFNAAM